MPHSAQTAMLMFFLCACFVGSEVKAFPKIDVEKNVQRHYSQENDLDCASHLPSNGHPQYARSADIEATIPNGHFTQNVTKCTSNFIYANCAHGNFRDIPQDLPETLRYLDLSWNLITALKDLDFIRYKHLVNLNLQRNMISSLSNKSFFGLAKLRILNLRNNRLEMNSTMFPLEVFRHLTSLTHLVINCNNPNPQKTYLVYPDQALSWLTNLRKLYMDGLPSHESSPFGAGFRNLTHLRKLRLSGYIFGYCKMEGLTNDTFEHFENLEVLELQDCYIKGNKIESGAFEPLKRLRSLNINHNEDIDTEYLKNVFYGLRNAVNLTELKMQLTINRYSLGICLGSSYIEYFPQYLKKFDARENSLEAVDRQVIGKLSPTLETLNLDGNKFVFGTYLEDLPEMKNLKHISLNGGSFSYRIPKLYPYHEYGKYGMSSPINSSCSLYAERDYEYVKYDKSSPLDFSCYSYEERDPGEIPKEFVLRLPPNLKSIAMNNVGLTYTLSCLKVDPNNTLENLTLQSNHFHSLEGPFHGLNSLKLLDVSSSYVSNISNFFFTYLTSLEILRIDTNLIGNHFSTDKHDQVFSPLTRLRILNMSFSDIRVLSPNVFRDLKNLTHLLLDRNPLSALNVTITQMMNLQILNLSYTHIPTLPQETREHIDMLLNDGKTVTVYMAGTPIDCDCDNFKFIKWMTNSKAFKDNFTDYRCQREGIEKQITDEYKQTLTLLIKECASHVIEFFIVGSSTFVVFCLIACAILYRFRWNIRYIYYAAYMQYSKKSRDTDNSFEYDAFICYDESDRIFAERILDKELTNRNLKIFVHRRDFTAGEFITSNIVQAVCCSRRTVVILTQSLLESHWCSYEIEMARMESLYTGRKVLIFVLMEHIPVEKLGRDLLYNIKNNTYQEYPGDDEDEEQMKVWWDKLASDIRN